MYRTATRDQEFSWLMSTRYGVPRTSKRNGNWHTGVSVMTTVDAGTDVVAQPGVTAAEELPEYVVDRVPAVLPRPAEPAPPLAPVQPPGAVAPGPSAPPAAPAAPPSVAPAAPPPVAQPMPSPPPSPAQPMPSASPSPAQPMPAPSPPPGPATQQAAVPASIAGSPLTDADLAQDIRAILSGGASPSAGSAAPMSDPGPPLPMSEDQHKIFNKIADSL